MSHSINYNLILKNFNDENIYYANVEVSSPDSVDSEIFLIRCALNSNNEVDIAETEIMINERVEEVYANNYFEVMREKTQEDFDEEVNKILNDPEYLPDYA